MYSQQNRQRKLKSKSSIGQAGRFFANAIAIIVAISFLLTGLDFTLFPTPTLFKLDGAYSAPSAEPNQSRPGIDTELDQQNQDQSSALSPVKHLGGNIHDIEPAGDIVWITRGPRITAVDFSNRSAPKILNPGIILGARLSVEGQLGFAWGGKCPCVLDLADPANPRIVARFEHDAPIYEAILIDQFAYLLSTDGVLQAWDLHVPDAPVPAGSISGIEMGEHWYFQRLFRLDKRLLIGGQDLLILDLRKQKQPEVMAKLANPGLSSGYWRRMAAASIGGRDLFYVVSQEGILGKDLSDPSNPVELDPIGYYDHFTADRVESIAVSHSGSACMAVMENHSGFQYQGRVYCKGTPGVRSIYSSEPFTGKIVSHDGSYFIPSRNGLEFSLKDGQGMRWSQRIVPSLTDAQHLELEELDGERLLLADSGLAAYSAKSAESSSWMWGGGHDANRSDISVGGGLACMLELGLLDLPSRNLEIFSLDARPLGSRSVVGDWTIQNIRPGSWPQIHIEQHDRTVAVFREGRMHIYDISNIENNVFHEAPWNLGEDHYILDVEMHEDRILVLSTSGGLGDDGMLVVHQFAIQRSGAGVGLIYLGENHLGRTSKSHRVSSRLVIWGNRGFVLAHIEGAADDDFPSLFSFNLESPAEAPVHLELETNPGDLLFDIAGGYAFIGSDIYDISEHGKAVPIGRLLVNRYPVKDIKVTDNAIFAAQGRYGISVYEHGLDWRTAPAVPTVQSERLLTQTATLIPTAFLTRTPSPRPSPSHTPTSPSTPDDGRLWLPVLRSQ